MKVGDTVVLKSGSTQMSVERIRKDGHVVCVWSDVRQKIHRCTFPAAVLRPFPR